MKRKYKRKSHLYLERSISERDSCNLCASNEKKDFVEFDTHRIYSGEDGQKEIKRNPPYKHVKCKLLQGIGRSMEKENTAKSYKARKL